jgi:hypothetical protein
MSKKEKDQDKAYIEFLQEAVNVGTGAPKSDLGSNWNWGTVKDLLDYGEGKELKTTLDEDELNEVYEKISGKKKDGKLSESKKARSPISMLEAEDDTEFAGPEKEKGEENDEEDEEDEVSECKMEEGTFLEQESDVLSRLINEMDALDDEDEEPAAEDEDEKEEDEDEKEELEEEAEEEDEETADEEEEDEEEKEELDEEDVSADDSEEEEDEEEKEDEEIDEED